jgi:hypothetical protein
MTKEQQQYKIGELETTLTGLENRSKAVRKEFAKAFGWEKKRDYSYDTEYRCPTWAEIFIELGKLLAKQKRLDYVSDVENLNLRVQESEGKEEDLHNR